MRFEWDESKNNENVRKHSLDFADAGANDNDIMNSSRTDWDKLRSTNDDIDTSDIPELDDGFFDRAELRVPEGTVPVFLTLDEETAEWFRSRQGDFRKNINDALRDYADSHR